jgi:hypothetical protein
MKGLPMRSNLRLASIALLLFSGLRPVAAQQTLQWKFTPEQEWNVQLEQTTTWQTTIAGKTSQTRLDCDMDLTWKVEKVTDEGSAIIAQRFQRIKVSRESAKIPAISYDSQATTPPSNDAKPIAESLAPLLKCVLHITLSPRGEITETSLDTATTEALASNPGLKAFLSGEGLKTLLRNSDVILPATAVKAGERWEQSGDVETSLGKMQYHRHYELLPAESEKVAKIGVTTDFKLEPAKAEEAGRPHMKSHKQDGTFFFDTTAGRLQSSSVTQQLITQSLHKDTTIQVKLDSTTKMTLLDK